MGEKKERFCGKDIRRMQKNREKVFVRTGMSVQERGLPSPYR